MQNYVFFLTYANISTKKCKIIARLLIRSAASQYKKMTPMSIYLDNPYITPSARWYNNLDNDLSI